MIHRITLGIALSVSITSFAVAGGEIPFVFTADGGAIPKTDLEHTGEGISFYFQPMVNAQFPNGITEILSLQLELNGLKHTFPDDLDIYLYDPYGGDGVEIMTDRGGGFALPGKEGVTLIFNDLAQNLPPDESEIFSGTYRPEGTVTEPVDHGGGLSNFVGLPGGDGMNRWLLFIGDDSERDIGSFSSWTLRGTTVPEPVTLSLLALGAVAFVRRRRA